MKKITLQIVGYTSVILGFIGVAVPLLPTTPFLLLAVYCFSKSSPKMNRWLLQNRLFGKYLRNYENGLGIPMPVKIAANITLWSSILFTAFVLIDEWWIRGILIVIAAFVTVHILKIKTLHKLKKILVVAPTQMEIAKFITDIPSHIKVIISGIGPYKTTYNVTEAINAEDPQVVILAGIAGAYTDSGLKIGDTVIVSGETSADMGSFSSGVFVPKFAEHYPCNHISASITLQQVESNSVSAAAAPYVQNSTSTLLVPKIENMEGAAFFYCCTEAKIPFIEIRSISNLVGDDIPKWDIDSATSKLCSELKNLINEITA